VHKKRLLWVFLCIGVYLKDRPPFTWRTNGVSFRIPPHLSQNDNKLYKPFKLKIKHSLPYIFWSLSGCYRKPFRSQTFKKIAFHLYLLYQLHLRSNEFAMNHPSITFITCGVYIFDDRRVTGFLRSSTRANLTSLPPVPLNLPIIIPSRGI